MRNKPYNKRNSITRLGSDLTTAIQEFHYSGELIKKDINQTNQKGKE